MHSEGTEEPATAGRDSGAGSPPAGTAGGSRAARTAIALHALVLGGCAIVQWNDPDPLRWMILYGAIALVAVLDLLGRPQRGVATLLTLFSVGWMLSLTAEARSVEALLPSEVGREWMGLAFAGCSAGLLAVRAHLIGRGT